MVWFPGYHSKFIPHSSSPHACSHSEFGYLLLPLCQTFTPKYSHGCLPHLPPATSSRGAVPDPSTRSHSSPPHPGSKGLAFSVAWRTGPRCGSPSGIVIVPVKKWCFSMPTASCSDLKEQLSIHPVTPAQSDPGGWGLPERWEISTRKERELWHGPP